MIIDCVEDDEEEKDGDDHHHHHHECLGRCFNDILDHDGVNDMLDDDIVVQYTLLHTGMVGPQVNSKCS